MLSVSIWTFLFSPSGRVSRAAFIVFSLVEFAASAMAILIDRLSGLTNTVWDTGPAEGLVLLGSAWPSVAVSIKRFHDLGQSGLWLLFCAALVVAGSVIAMADESADDFTEDLIFWSGIGCFALFLGLFLWLLLKRGNPGPNRFGEDPLARVRTRIDNDVMGDGTSA